MMNILYYKNWQIKTRKSGNRFIKKELFQSQIRQNAK